VNLFLRLTLVFYLIPHVFVVKNKIGLLFSVFINSSKYKIKIKNSLIFFKRDDFRIMQSLLALLAYSTSYSIKQGNLLEFSLDTKNKFEFRLDELSYEDKNLLITLAWGSTYGADFETDSNVKLQSARDKTFKIYQLEGKKIIETSNGIKFYMDSIHPGNSIIETFVLKIHQINLNDDWRNKIVVDVGAECGDTPLYYASMGATVYAFEPIKEYFEDMKRNLNLNPDLAKRIIPINAGIGKDGTLTFTQTERGVGGGSSFVTNVHGKNAKTSQVMGYSFESAFEKFNLKNVNLLKIDCKGCECFLKSGVLKNVDQVKIEFETLYHSMKIETFLNELEKAGFENKIYRTNPINYRISNKHSCHIYGKKIK